MPKYDKLIRDKILQIIESQGKRCKVEVMNEGDSPTTNTLDYEAHLPMFRNYCVIPIRVRGGTSSGVIQLPVGITIIQIL